jgi:hypothetical protein
LLVVLLVTTPVSGAASAEVERTAKAAAASANGELLRSREITY